MRSPIIAGNWKMNGLQRDAAELAASVRRLLEGFEGAEVVVCPPFTVLPAVHTALDGSRIRLGAQDMHWDPKGAFTGEVSPLMLKDAGCTFVILGHSERRHILGETNDMVNRKLKSALAHGLTPIVCVGELLEERTQKVTREVIERQMAKAFDGIPAADAPRAVVAYEPVWAIGTGLTATPAQAQEIHHFIRNLLVRRYNESIATGMRVLYGGSVKPDNIRGLMAEADVDGALVGGASLQASDFNKIARYKESA
jgi:triosephosphate isomerase (TIM)